MLCLSLFIHLFNYNKNVNRSDDILLLIDDSLK